MALMRVGVQAPQGSGGQVVDVDGPRARVTSISNVSSESVAYSADGGTTWAMVGAGAVSPAFNVNAGRFLLRKVMSNGSYPANVDIELTTYGVSTPYLTGDEQASAQAVVSDSGALPTGTNLADHTYLGSIRGTAQSTQSAVSTTAVVALTPTAVATACRLAWVDLKRPTGATTDATGYAAGVKTITLASAGTGAFYAGDVITFAGQSNEYTLLSGDSDVSNGGTIGLAGYGVLVAIAASATAITLVRRGAKLRVALNCDNDVEGLLCSQSDRSCDIPSGEETLRLGESVMLRSDVAITQVHVSANVSVLANNHRIEATFGV